MKDSFYDWFILDYLVKNKAKLKQYFQEHKSGKAILENMFADKDLSKNQKFALLAEESVVNNNIETITYEDQTYPKKLRQIKDPPAILYLWGSRPDDEEKTVAIVGSRKASKYTLEKTESIAGYLCKQGVTVISGMADGVDKKSHEAVFESNCRTITVLGESLVNEKRTKANKEFINKILSNKGCVLSEVAPWKSYGPRRFTLINRNRITSGLSDIVLIAEAKEKSGTNHTINFAKEQGRKLYAIMPDKKKTQNYDYMMSLEEKGIRLIQDGYELMNELR